MTSHCADRCAVILFLLDRVCINFISLSHRCLWVFFVSSSTTARTTVITRWNLLWFRRAATRWDVVTQICEALRSLKSTVGRRRTKADKISKTIPAHCPLHLHLSLLATRSWSLDLHQVIWQDSGEAVLKGYSGVNLIHGLTHPETVLDSLSRDQVCRALANVVLASSETTARQHYIAVNG